MGLYETVKKHYEAKELAQIRTYLDGQRKDDPVLDAICSGKGSYTQIAKHIGAVFSDYFKTKKEPEKDLAFDKGVEYLLGALDLNPPEYLMTGVGADNLKKINRKDKLKNVGTPFLISHLATAGVGLPFMFLDPTLITQFMTAFGIAFGIVDSTVLPMLMAESSIKSVRKSMIKCTNERADEFDKIIQGVYGVTLQVSGYAQSKAEGKSLVDVVLSELDKRDKKE